MMLKIQDQPNSGTTKIDDPVPHAAPNFDFEYNNLPPRRQCEPFRRRLPVHKHPNRSVVSGRIDKHLPNNGISTSKYNILTFLPKNLFEQFTKVANVYFLIIGIMQAIPSISVSDGRPDTFLPLGFIVLVTMIKDSYEDIKRYRADREENTKECQVLEIDGSKHVLKAKHWQDVRVGDIIRIEKDKYFPADCLLIACASPKGVSFIETKNLDGETNLKNKQLSKPIRAAFLSTKPDEELNTRTKAIFKYEAPNAYLYQLNGTVITEDGREHPVDNNSFVLRGCSLRNTDWAYGIVAYTGHDTKIMLNSVPARAKRSKLENHMSKQIMIVFVVQILICVFCSAYYSIWYAINSTHLPYLHISSTSDDNNSAYNFWTRFGNYLIIFSNFVPISLIVTLEMVKFFQGTLIGKDENLKHIPTGKPIAVQSSNLNEELGQIEYVFSDKTGTLTCNYMEYKKLTVNGICYGNNTDIPLETVKKNFPEVTNVNFRDKVFIDILRNPAHPEYARCKNFMMILGLCHTVQVELKDGKKIYNAASPDELALVSFAKFCGFEFTETDDNGNMVISYEGKTERYQLLQVLEFSSKRKRNSVILKNEKGEIVLFCKGADSVVKERLAPGKNDDLTKTLEELEKLGDEGLRTLLVAERKITAQEYEKWLVAYNEASCAPEKREEKVEDAQDLIEKDLILSGSTAIEDKLQDEVGITIEDIKRAGIKVWVLTGDKKETAINIGYSCNLLNKEIEKLYVEGEKVDEVQKYIHDAELNLDELKKEGKKRFALIVTGQALIQAVKDPLNKTLMKIAEECEAVICCRVSPKQKAEVVTLVRQTKPMASTLAIGDGANDVNMITAAHVGIGIRGVEGQQAARASDYAIGEFKFLKRLLLFHGRESYRKNSVLILYNFFKNICLVLPIFWVGFNMVFSGQRLYDSWLYAFFNVFYASWPIIIYALFDQEYSDTYLLENPYTYGQGIRNELFNTKRFWLWCFNASVQAVVIGYVSVLSMELDFASNKGYVEDIWLSGAMMLGACVVVVNLKVVVFSTINSPGSLVIITLSMAVYIICFAVLNYLTISDIYNFFNDIWSLPNFYIGNFLIVMVCTFFDFAVERIWILKKFEKEETQKITSPKAEEELMQLVTYNNKKSEPEEQVNRQLGGDLELTLREKKDVAPAVLERRLSRMGSRRHTGYAFSAEDPIGDKGIYKNVQN
jgi:phospholipid-transporting ATPase